MNLSPVNFIVHITHISIYKRQNTTNMRGEIFSNKVKSGKFIDRTNQEAFILRKGAHQVEYVNADLTLKSKIIWTSDTDYKLVLEDISNPTLVNLQVGDELSVHITEITNEYYVSETNFKGNKQTSQLWFA